MENARTLILLALEQATQILPSGKESLLAIAARALNPEAPVTREGIVETLGLHPSLAVAILVTADLAADTLSRRELGWALFQRISLHGRPPELTRSGELAVATFCVEKLLPLDDTLEGLVAQVLPLARAASLGETPEPLALEEARSKAEALQRTKVVAMEKGSKSKLGVPTEESIRRRGAQAVRALLHGLQQSTPNIHLCPTVAGEVAAALSHGFGTEAAAELVMELAELLESLPAEHLRPRGGNGR
jgi:hypothetical protein